MMRESKNVKSPYDDIVVIPVRDVIYVNELYMLE